MCGESGRSILTVICFLTYSCGAQAVRPCGTWIVKRTSIYGEGAGCATAKCQNIEPRFSASCLLRKSQFAPWYTRRREGCIQRNLYSVLADDVLTTSRPPPARRPERPTASRFCNSRRRYPCAPAGRIIMDISPTAPAGRAQEPAGFVASSAGSNPFTLRAWRRSGEAHVALDVDCIVAPLCRGSASSPRR